MSFEVVYTNNFERELKQLAKRYRSIKKDLAKLIYLLEKRPVQGTSIRSNCYKIRLAITSKGKGKSGGGRVISHVYLPGKTVYLLSIYDKSEKDTISDREVEMLLGFIK